MVQSLQPVLPAPEEPHATVPRADSWQEVRGHWSPLDRWIGY